MDRSLIYERFARVLVEVGADLRPGEAAVIQAEPKHRELVLRLARACYRAGARYVWVEYEDDALSRIRAEESRPEQLGHVPEWLSGLRRAYGGDAVCVICLSTPRLTSGPAELEERLEAVRAGERRGREGFQEAVSGGGVSIVKTVVPGPDWAAMVYPELDRAEALERLWDRFVSICRLDREDPVEAWRAHQRRLRERRAWLDGLELDALYLEGPGTRLSVGLVQGGRWIGGCAENTRTGRTYVPNIPTEEIFFVPDWRRVEGVVSSTMPLNYGGRLIEGIRLEVREGRVSAFSARKGEELLASILNTDQGSRRFGEVSLVPVCSPIYQTGEIFYNTLLDENAVCHMALGRGTPGILEGGYALSKEERERAGINDSAIHVDFMVGSEELSVDGWRRTGERVPILRKGDWVPE